MKIADLARASGVSADVIRVWERRYGALRPARDGGNHRIYAAADLERLLLLRDLTAGGEAISRVAALSDGELRDLAELRTPSAPASLLAESLMYVRQHDAAGLMRYLETLAGRFTPERLCDEILGPLLDEVGAYWLRDRSLIAKEHLTTAAVEAVLERQTMLDAQNARRCVLFAVPAHERHAVGLKMAARIAARHGFRPIVLGPGAGPQEIADVARRLDAAGVGVSVVYRRAEQTLREIARGIAPLPLWVGGGKAPHGPWTRIASMQQFAGVLNAI